jgi:hypothetical protein
MGKVVTPLNQPNKTQNFYPADDKWEMIMFPFLASTAIEEGTAVSPQIVSNNVTGNLTKMGVENVTGSDFMGILAEAIVSTDTDYATAGKLKGVWVPKAMTATAYFTVGAGTFTAADVFKTVEIHSDSKSLAVDTLGKGARIMEFISSTRGKCMFSLPQTEVA